MTVHGVRLVKYRPSSIVPVTISFMSWTVLKMVVTEKTRSTRDIQNAKKPQPSGPLVGLSQSHPQKRRPMEVVTRLRPSEILESWDFESLTYPHESFCVPFCTPLVWEPGRTWSIHHPAHQTSNLAYLLRTLDEY